MYTQRPVGFEYHRPGSVDEAVSLLTQSDDARPLAGGHSLIPAMKLRLSAPATLVDLAGIPGLEAIEPDGDGVRIGALATHAAVHASGLVKERSQILAETAGVIGDRQVRQRGTIGGSLAHADPGADYPTTVKALQARIVTQGPGGAREIGADDFFTGLFSTALSQGEIVVAVRVPGGGPGMGGAYEKHRHPASRYAVVGVAAVVRLDGGTVREARITVGGAAGSPVNVEPAAQALVGSQPTAEAIVAAADAVPGALDNLLSDPYASADYRAHLAKVLTRRALTAAAERAAR